MSSIEMRLAALEAQVVDLKTENELLKMLTPLEAMTEGLKAASPEEVAAFSIALTALVKTPKASKGSKLSKEEKEKKNTNPSGPAEFNVLIQAVWHEMAASAGVIGEHDDAFKKASKEVGVTFQIARAEASRRKADMEGMPTPAAKAPKAKPTTVTAIAKPTPKPVAAPKPVPVVAIAKTTPVAVSPVEVPSDEDIASVTPGYTAEMRAKMKLDSEAGGWTARLFDGKARWLETETGNVYEYEGYPEIGVYDAESGEFCPN